MTLHADGTGEISFHPVQMLEVRWIRYLHPDRLLTRVRSVVFFDTGTATPGPELLGDCRHAPELIQPGDLDLLTVVRPHLLRHQYLRVHLPPEDVADGNPYWCEYGSSFDPRGLCGA